LLQHLLVGLVMNTQPLRDYISRLLGRSVAFDEVVSLSSAQQAAVRSWLRKNRDYGLPAAVKSKVSVKMLANGQELAGAAPAALSMETPLSAPPVEPGGAVAGVGVDIEYASGLPEAEDYRTHPFFVENFSKSEIVHCIESDDSRLSFAGLWAAKEAIAKARGIDIRPGGLSRIEIGHDGHGRPTSRFGSISISHAGEVAIAVCVASHAVSSTAVGKGLAGGGSAASIEIPPQPPAAPAGPRVSRSVMFALCLSAMVNILLAAALFHSHYF
jgi:phosphopantetheine--protein transferase-like protein